jgi:hypothetical protein
MNPKAITEATIRLTQARASLIVMESDDWVFEEFELAWRNFLLEASSVYSKLEQGAKSSGKSRAWFGRVKHVRKNDELLSYIHHARNTEEHSLEGSTNRTEITAKPANKWTKILPPKEGDNTISATVQSNQPLAVTLISPGIRLVPVTDERYHDTFNPPTTHLGQLLVDRSPIAVARLGIQYFESLISEATNLAD